MSSKFLERNEDENVPFLKNNGNNWHVVYDFFSFVMLNCIPSPVQSQEKILRMSVKKDYYSRDPWCGGGTPNPYFNSRKSLNMSVKSEFIFTIKIRIWEGAGDMVKGCPLPIHSKKILRTWMKFYLFSVDQGLLLTVLSLYFRDEPPSQWYKWIFSYYLWVLRVKKNMNIYTQCVSSLTHLV